MAFTVYTDNLTYINNTLTAYMGENITNMANAIEPLAWGLLAIYIMIWGLAAASNQVQEHIMNMGLRFLKLWLIFCIGIKLMEYNTYITDVFYNGPEQLAASLTKSSSTGGIAGSLDTVLYNGFMVGKKFWDKASIFDAFGAYIVAIAVWGLTFVVTLYSFFLIGLAKVALALLIVCGPLFIMSAMFNATIHFFTSWIQQMANYFLVMLLTVATNLIFMTMFNRASATAAAITDTTQIDKIVPFLITGGLSLFLLASILSIASGLAGGMALSSFGVGRLGVRAVVGGARAVAKPPLRLVGKGAKMAARAGWNQSGGRAIKAYQNRNKNSINNP